MVRLDQRNSCLPGRKLQKPLYCCYSFASGSCSKTNHLRHKRHSGDSWTNGVAAVGTSAGEGGWKHVTGRKASAWGAEECNIHKSEPSTKRYIVNRRLPGSTTPRFKHEGPSFIDRFPPMNTNTQQQKMHHTAGTRLVISLISVYHSRRSLHLHIIITRSRLTAISPTGAASTG